MHAWRSVRPRAAAEAQSIGKRLSRAHCEPGNLIYDQFLALTPIVSGHDTRTSQLRDRLHGRQPYDCLDFDSPGFI
jgi:hypothetical protein